MITIVDYGVCNVGSLANMLKKIRQTYRVTSDPDLVFKADKLLLPGVGAFDAGMKRLNEAGLADAIRAAAEREVPLLGICLGMQLLCDSSEEGMLPGLGLIPARSKKFVSPADGPEIRVPHMGWNEVCPQRSHPLFNGLEDRSRFYFVHSYKVECANPDHELAKSTYGGEFTASLAKDHVLAVQFHPEKSHKFGMKMLSNFAELKL